MKAGSFVKRESMDFKTQLKNGSFCLDLKSGAKEALIAEMVDMLVADGKITDREAVLASVLERERRMSTGMQFGVAVPHGKTDAVPNLVVAFGIKRDGIDFGALDGQLSHIFVMTISPAHRTGPHIQYLSQISKMLQSSTIRQRLLEAETVEEVADILTSDSRGGVS